MVPFFELERGPGKTKLIWGGGGGNLASDEAKNVREREDTAVHPLPVAFCVHVGQAQPKHPIVHDAICQKFLQTGRGGGEMKHHEQKRKATAKGFSGTEASTRSQ